MGVLTIIIAAISALAGPAASLFQDVMGLWSSAHSTGAVNMDELSNQAIGAAQAAVALETDIQKQIALVETTLTASNPAAPITQVKAVAAMAVQQQSIARGTTANP